MDYKEYGLTIDEVRSLINYFYTDGGYISHERHELVHVVIRKLEAFIHAIENQQKDNQTTL